MEQLHRDLAAQDLVGAPPHLGHPARRDQLLEAVAAAEQPTRLDGACPGRGGVDGRVRVEGVEVDTARRG